MINIQIYNPDFHRWEDCSDGFNITKEQFNEARRKFKAQYNVESSLLDASHLLPKYTAVAILKDMFPQMSDFDLFTLSHAVISPRTRFSEEE